MKLRSFGLYFTSFFFLAFAAHGQTPSTSTATSGSRHDERTSSISGTVFDPEGRAAAGARVTLLYAMTQLEVRETNSQGQFQFESLLPGTYQIVATLPSFSDVTSEVDLSRGEKQVADIHL
jgi:hypothetical protein